MNGGGEGGAVEGLENKRRMAIKSDGEANGGGDGEDDAAIQVKGGGAEVAKRTASPGMICNPELFKASIRVLSRYLRCLIHPSSPLTNARTELHLAKKMEDDIKAT